MRRLLLLLAIAILLPPTLQAESTPSLGQLLGPAAEAVPVSCPEPPQICGDPECTPIFSNCSRVYTDILFIRQKDNGKCVYQCPYDETCTDIACGTGTETNSLSHRVRIGPYPVGQCPAADLSFCTDGEWLPPGAE